MFLQHQHITVCIFICCKVHDCWENTSPCLRFLPQILSRIFFRLTPCRNKHLSHKCSCTFSVVTQFAYMVRRRVARDIKIARRKNTIINFSPSHSPSNVTLLKYSYNKNQSSIIASSQWCREMWRGADCCMKSVGKVSLALSERKKKSEKSWGWKDSFVAKKKKTLFANRVDKGNLMPSDLYFIMEYYVIIIFSLYCFSFSFLFLSWCSVVF